jgi:hypothetical protein
MRRRFLFILPMSAIGFLLSACSPMNSEFSCNATAGDSCMTIEQVDAMTRFADVGRKKYGSTAEKHSQLVAQNQPESSLVWVAPHQPLFHAQG